MRKIAFFLCIPVLFLQLHFCKTAQAGDLKSQNQDRIKILTTLCLDSLISMLASLEEGDFFKFEASAKEAEKTAYDLIEAYGKQEIEKLPSFLEPLSENYFKLTITKARFLAMKKNMHKNGENYFIENSCLISEVKRVEIYTAIRDFYKSLIEGEALEIFRLMLLDHRKRQEEDNENQGCSLLDPDSTIEIIRAKVEYMTQQLNHSDDYFHFPMGNPFKKDFPIGF